MGILGTVIFEDQTSLRCDDWLQELVQPGYCFWLLTGHTFSQLSVQGRCGEVALVLFQFMGPAWWRHESWQAGGCGNCWNALFCVDFVLGIRLIPLLWSVSVFPEPWACRVPSVLGPFHLVPWESSLTSWWPCPKGAPYSLGFSQEKIPFPLSLASGESPAPSRPCWSLCSCSWSELLTFPPYPCS